MREATFQAVWGVAGSLWASASGSGCDRTTAARASSWAMKARMSSAELWVQARGRWVGTGPRSATQNGATWEGRHHPHQTDAESQASRSVEVFPACLGESCFLPGRDNLAGLWGLARTGFRHPGHRRMEGIIKRNPLTLKELPAVGSGSGLRQS